jgi:DNA-binding CsgD family transcriptional regulator
MTQQEIANINETYFKLLEQQKIVAADLDYSILERHIPNLQKLADIGNSIISVFDACKKEHVFYSSNVSVMLGYNPQEAESVGQHFLDNKIHPDDFYELMQNALSIFKLFFNFSVDEKINHKLISEYRILNAANNYVRVIEQQQVLELDSKGNLWLALSILDISPNQKNMNEGLLSELLNFRTGIIIPFIETKELITVALTKRETEVLKLVKDGFLSKEISDKLAISLHTVNTHRQRVLEKLGVSNSMEAVALASKLGLI